MNPIVSGFFLLGMHAAPRNDDYICVFAHIKIVVYQIIHAAVRHAGGNIHRFPLGARLNMNFQPRRIFFGFNHNVFRGFSGRAFSVFPDVIRPAKFSFIAGDSSQQHFCDLVHSAVASLPSGHISAFSSPSSFGKISSRAPCSRTMPSSMTTISSAIDKIRS